MVTLEIGLRGYLPSFLILNFAPLAPQLWGKSQLASKSPPSEQSLAWGTNGGLDVANNTSQTTS
ncbi:hypothetical protein BJP34_26820 [Moorena producens PAL-8-15-08-1]|uniref:Uncharacterized protein n=1 Tax=Moorena producens PAL-8-15-08-1 TaxID=1458985 RepID=A0A1D8TYD8_9CYAN|nr:hypothetical protein BJP34_26820 [Moorena producens PAL-8-15-08-1]